MPLSAVVVLHKKIALLQFTEQESQVDGVRSGPGNSVLFLMFLVLRILRACDETLTLRWQYYDTCSGLA